MENERGRNYALIMGKINGDFRFSHSVKEESFYETFINVERQSGFVDSIPILVSEKMVDVTDKWDGRYVAVVGTFRSYNKKIFDRTKLLLHLRAKVFMECPNESYFNNISLSGTVCKKPVYRKTPLGRNVCDIILAVSRSYGRKDYIPCISWEQNADVSKSLNTGDRIEIAGRIQSRDYIKVFSETEQETRTAYEVSISKMEVVECAEQKEGRECSSGDWRPGRS